MSGRSWAIIAMVWAGLALGGVKGRGSTSSVDLVPLEEFITTEIGTLQKLSLQITGEMTFESQKKPVPLRLTVPKLMGRARNSWQGCYFLYQDRLGKVFAQHISDAHFYKNRGPFFEVGTVGPESQLQLGQDYKLGALVYIELNPGLLERWLDNARTTKTFYAELVGEALLKE
jgi:hypothetical protein